MDSQTHFDHGRALLSAVIANPASVAIVLITATLLYQLFPSSSRKNLPPGPPGLPVVGNLFQLSEDVWFKFTEWKKTYGPVVYLNLAGQNVVVLNTLQAASDLLDRRAANYSSRPNFVVACNMLTEGLFFVFQSRTELWRRMRRAAHEALHSGVVKDFLPLQTTEATILINDMIATPTQWEEHLTRNAGSTVLSATYDLPPTKSVNEPAMQKLTNFTNSIVRAGYVDGFLVEFFPALQHIPAAFAPWKKEALRAAPQFTQLFKDLYFAVKTRVEDGDDVRPSVSASMVEKQAKYDLSDKETAWLIATIAAAFETMSGTMAWFMLAMVLYPDAQKKAQEEIDAVVGRGRLPSFDDLDKLVYIRAMVKETLRWHPVGPLGMQHRSDEDDVYEGYFIPKGTVCIANIWCVAINRDPELWGEDADAFRPERHIGPDGQLAQSPADTKDEGHVSFGFGRRICVGRHMARNTLFLNMAYVLWMFNIKAPLGPDGKDAVCTEKSIDMGLVVRPQEYQYRFEIRAPDALAIFEGHKEFLDI
ncbi:cytochrome P450 [Earliella scabrosa]|nr:cytochrome P450 [Earliella scabrosa]